MKTVFPPEPVTGSTSAPSPGPGAKPPLPAASTGEYVRSQRNSTRAARAATSTKPPATRPARRSGCLFGAATAVMAVILHRFVTKTTGRPDTVGDLGRRTDPRRAE